MRRSELKIRRARGFLLIVAIVVLVIVAIAVAALGNMTSADVRASTGGAQSAQAYFATTSGTEYAANRYFNGTDCASLNDSGVGVGSASFSLSPTPFLPTNGTATSATTTTTAAVTAGATVSIPVVSTAGFQSGGRIQIDSELIDYTGITATSFNALSRGAGGTTAAAHASGAAVTQTLPNSLTATSASLTTASVSVSVTSTAGYAPNGRILIDSELINYSSISATSFNGLMRGVGGTAVAAHASGATVSQNVCLVSSTGSASGGSVKRRLDAALGVATNANAGALGTMGADAMIVYAKGALLTGAGSDNNIYYRLWDSSANNWGVERTSTQTVSASSSPVYFSVAFARTRNEAIMGVLDGNRNLYIHVWNGITWSNPLGANVAFATTSSNTSRNFQIAYEYTSDHALIVYQDITNPPNTPSNPRYATWEGTTLTAAGMILPPAGTYPVANTAARHLWFRLAPRNVAGSNDILMMSSDNNQDVFGMRWTGTAWSNMGTATRWDNSTSNTNNHEAIDVAWQSDGSKAVFVYGDASNQGIRYRTWTAVSSTLSALSAATTLTTPGGYTAARFEWVRLYPGPSNNILLMMQTATAPTNPSLESVTWNSGTSAFNTTTTGHESNALENFQGRSFDFAWETLPGYSGSGWLLWGSLTATGGNYVHTRYLNSPTTWDVTIAAVRDRASLVQLGALAPSGRFVAGAYHSAAAILPANRVTESITTLGGKTPWTNSATIPWGLVANPQQGEERVFAIERNTGYINAGTSGTGFVKILQMQESY